MFLCVCVLLLCALGFGMPLVRCGFVCGRLTVEVLQLDAGGDGDVAFQEFGDLRRKCFWF